MDDNLDRTLAHLAGEIAKVEGLIARLPLAHAAEQPHVAHRRAHLDERLSDLQDRLKPVRIATSHRTIDAANPPIPIAPRRPGDTRSPYDIEHPGRPKL